MSTTNSVTVNSYIIAPVAILTQSLNLRLLEVIVDGVGTGAYQTFETKIANTPHMEAYPSGDHVLIPCKLSPTKDLVTGKNDADIIYDKAIDLGWTQVANATQLTSTELTVLDHDDWQEFIKINPMFD